MTPKRFVELAKQEHDRFFAHSFASPPRTAVAAKLAELNLDPRQQRILRKAIRYLLTDVFYTWLLAIDGAGLGEEQHSYRLTDEEGNLLTDCGLIEAEAYAAFHEEENERLIARTKAKSAKPAKKREAKPRKTGQVERPIGTHGST